MSSKTCGQCQLFVRIKSFQGSRTGICNKYDYNLLSDCTYAKFCKSFKSKKFDRRKD